MCGGSAKTRALDFFFQTEPGAVPSLCCICNDLLGSFDKLTLLESRVGLISSLKECPRETEVEISSRPGAPASRRQGRSSTRANLWLKYSVVKYQFEMPPSSGSPMEFDTCMSVPPEECGWAVVAA